MRTQYLFGIQSKPTTPYLTNEHSHSFWQLEINLRGQFSLNTPTESLTLKRNEMVLIPPYLSHSFHYPTSQIHYLSIKFEAPKNKESTQLTHIRPNSLNTHLREMFILLQPSTSKASKHNQAILNSLLSALMFEQWPRITDTSNQTDPIISKVKQCVEDTQGTGITVEALASQVGMSPSRLLTRFRHQEKRTLKNYIDQERAECACDLLKYSTMNIAEIADQMNFPDIYSFSRFFKRMKGISPKQFRT